MKALSRRSVTTGLCCGRDGYPGCGTRNRRRRDPMERIKHHLRELERAMRDFHGVETHSVLFDKGPKGNLMPMVLVVARTS